MIGIYRYYAAIARSVLFGNDRPERFGPSFAPVQRLPWHFRSARRETWSRSVDLRSSSMCSTGPTREPTQVTVARRVPAVDVRASAIPTHLNQSLLNNLPVTRALADLINLAPGVTDNVAFGGTKSSNAIYVNGVQTTDPLDQRPLVGLNHNWLEQMEVSALGAGAEYGGFTAVAANAIVKSGSNRFSGLGEYWTTRSGWVRPTILRKPTSSSLARSCLFGIPAFRLEVRLWRTAYGSLPVRRSRLSRTIRRCLGRGRRSEMSRTSSPGSTPL